MKNTVAIIGTGRLGTRLSEQLIMDNVCDELLLWNRSINKLEGTILSLRLWLQSIDSKTRVKTLDLSNLDKIDIIVITIKEDYDPRQIVNESLPNWLPNNMRYIGIKKDFPLLRHLCRKISNFTGTIIVITNPVDVFTTLITRWLPEAQVLGVGNTLDAARFSYFLETELKKKILHNEIILAGEHGSDLIPLRSFWSTELRLLLNEKNTYQILKKVRSVGFDIINYLGFSVQDCVKIFSDDIEWLLGSNNIITTMSIYHKNACIGLPISKSESSSIIKMPLNDEFELNLVDKVENGIENIVQHILEDKDGNF